MIEYDISKPRSNRASLLEGLILLAEVVVLIKIDIRVIVVTNDVYQSRLSVLLLYLVKCPVDEPNRHRIKVLREVTFPSDDFSICRVYYPRHILHHTTASDTFLVRRAAWMHHLWHQLEQEVVGYTQKDSVYRFVHVDCTEISVVFRNLCRMWRHYLVIAALDPLIHSQTSLRCRQLIHYCFVHVLEQAFLNGILPSGFFEEHT